MAGCVGLTVALVATALNFPSRQAAAGDDASDIAASFGTAPLGDVPFEVEPASADIGSEHPNYRHSVVAGGVHSVDDVERAVSQDAVVRDHYAGVSVARLKVVRAPERREAYMSYRIGDRVYWTSKKIALSEGEAVLTDGETTIRARCGNLISDRAMAPTSADEPAASTFDAVEPAPAVTAAARNPERSISGVGGGGALVAPGGPAPSSAQGGPLSNSAGNVGPGGVAGSGGAISPGPTQRQTPEGGSSDPSWTDEPGPNPPEWNGPPTFGGGPNGENNPPGFENPPGFDPPGFNPPGFGEEPEPGGDPETPGGNDPPFDPELPPIEVQTPPEVVPVPEPATLVLLGSGLAFVAWRARRQQSKGRSE